MTSTKVSLVYFPQMCLLGLAIGWMSSVKETVTSDIILLFDDLWFASFSRQEVRTSYHNRAGSAWSHR